MILNKVKYSNLKSKQKENYNYHKIASALAEYGFDCMRLNNDWQGADFIAVHNDGKTFLKVQQKGRFEIKKIYQNKDIYMAFIEDGVVRIYYHDKAVEIIPDNVRNSKSWQKTGHYSWGKTPKIYNEIITNLT